MPEPRDPRALIEAAEQAASGGDYASAETLLREAALLQEATLGPLHPDLANTLNNLGVVCEITDHPDEAERCFRQALSIATTILAPDHPFVATSRKNLVGFCDARGKPVDLPPLPPVSVQPEVHARLPVDPPVEPPAEQPVEARLEPLVKPSLEASVAPLPKPPVEPPPQASSEPLPEPPLEAGQPELPAESQDVDPVVQGRSVRPLAIGALSAAAALIVILTAARPWVTSTEQAEASARIATAPTTQASPSPRVAATAEAIAAPKVPTKTMASRRDETRDNPITTAAPARPTVVRARLCGDLEEWRCDPADRPVPSGPLFFYTQVKSMTATTVRHRWYRGDRLFQSIELRIQASPGMGYRTFSRQTMNSESAGSWRVELRAEDGALLHEERFSVR